MCTLKVLSFIFSGQGCGGSWACPRNACQDRRIYPGWNAVHYWVSCKYTNSQTVTPEVSCATYHCWKIRENLEKLKDAHVILIMLWIVTWYLPFLCYLTRQISMYHIMGRSTLKYWNTFILRMPSSHQEQEQKGQAEICKVLSTDEVKPLEEWSLGKSSEKSGLQMILSQGFHIVAILSKMQ